VIARFFKTEVTDILNVAPANDDVAIQVGGK
jgi:hypothetical protein